MKEDLKGIKSKCTEISSKAWPLSKFNSLLFRVYIEVFMVFKGFGVQFSKYGLLSGIFGKMDFVLSPAKKGRKKLAKIALQKLPT